MLAPGNQNLSRQKALDLVSRRRMPSALPQLFTIARGPDPELRTAAVKRIGELAGAAQLPELQNLFTLARDPGDLEATEEALATASQRAPDPEQWAKRLAAGWDSAPVPQKCGLVRVFSAMGGTNALQAVRLGVTDPRPEVRTVSLRALGGWNNGAGSADLLEMARSAPDTTERTLALHGFLELAAQSDLPATNRLALCRGAAPLVKTDDQKRMLLAALGELRSAEALELIRPMLDEPALKEEACTATVTVSEGILQGRNASQSAPRVIEALEQVVKLEPKPELLKRAQSALENARSKNHGT
jgi:HEAT repeat protein